MWHVEFNEFNYVWTMSMGYIKHAPCTVPVESELWVERVCRFTCSRLWSRVFCSAPTQRRRGPSLTIPPSRPSEPAVWWEWGKRWWRQWWWVSCAGLRRLLLATVNIQIKPTAGLEGSWSRLEYFVILSVTNCISIGAVSGVYICSCQNSMI